jgi:hypothetical protein
MEKRTNVLEDGLATLGDLSTLSDFEGIPSSMNDHNFDYDAGLFFSLYYLSSRLLKSGGRFLSSKLKVLLNKNILREKFESFKFLTFTSNS